MAEESRYVSDTPPSNKRKYDEPSSESTPPSGRRTGFSSGPISPDSTSAAADHPPSYNSVPPPPAADDVQAQVQNAKLRAQEIASRLLSGASAGGGGGGGGGSGVGVGVGVVGGGGIGGFDSKRARVENGGGFDAFDGKPVHNSASPIPFSYGYGQGTSKKIDIPNGRVGVIIGKAGETIKYLQLQSGAKIQVTRDMDADPNAPTRTVELTGTAEQIAKAEQLINDVLAEAEAGGSAMFSRRVTGQSGSGNPYVMKVPNNKVGLVIGKGGETIKNMQARTGAHIQVIPLHLPPGDTSNERNIHIDGTPEQIEAAKQLIYEATSENRMRSQGMSGGYSQHNYQARPPQTSWGGAPQMQQPGYGYVQPGMYSGPSPQYNMGQPQYGSYPPQTSGGYNSSWDQSAGPPSQHGGQGGGYDYYNQQPPQQQQQQQQSSGGPGGSSDNSGYGYSQPPTSYGQPGQGYSQDGYGGYHGHPSSGYGQPPPYDQQGYNAAGYSNAVNPSQEGHTSSYGSQGDSTQAPPSVQPSSAAQQGYGTGYPQAGGQPGYGASQAGYGSQPPSYAGYGSYGPPQGKQPPGNPSPYGQAQQSMSAGGGYGQPPAAAYSQPDAATQHVPPSGYSAGAGQTAYGSAYGQPGYGQPPSQYYGGGYQQPPAAVAAAATAYSANGGPPPPTSQPAAPTDAAKASPPT